MGYSIIFSSCQLSRRSFQSIPAASFFPLPVKSLVYSDLKNDPSHVIPCVTFLSNPTRQLPLPTRVTCMFRLKLSRPLITPPLNVYPSVLHPQQPEIHWEMWNEWRGAQEMASLPVKSLPPNCCWSGVPPKPGRSHTGSRQFSSLTEQEEDLMKRPRMD